MQIKGLRRAAAAWNARVKLAMHKNRPKKIEAAGGRVQPDTRSRSKGVGLGSARVSDALHSVDSAEAVRTAFSLSLHSMLLSSSAVPSHAHVSIRIAEHHCSIRHASFSHQLPYEAGASDAVSLLPHHVQLGNGRPPKQLWPRKWLTSDRRCSSAFPTRTEAGKKSRQRRSQNGKLRLCAPLTLLLAAQGEMR
ncbi:hypothetical protein L1887_47868 [Cichorium endivia]|nr:hypothetical protein L1887_47868 [Cichorium endivia]